MLNMKLSDAYKDFWKNYVNFKDDATVVKI